MKIVNNFWNLVFIVAEVLLVAFVAYRESATYYSFDVFYCVPILHAARLSSIRALRYSRSSDTQIPVIIGIFVGIVWTTGEFLAVYPDYPWSAWLLNTFARSVTFTVIGRVMAKVWREREFSRKDLLTDLANRLEFTERFAIEQSRSERSGKPYSLLFIDINQFKLLNDEQGHHVGDEALKALSAILINNSRKGDVVSRFGGDEFALLFPETNEASCDMLANRILEVTKTEFKNKSWPISLSVGCVTGSGLNKSIDELLQIADGKMYSMKKETRMQWRIEPVIKEIHVRDVSQL
ncbi:MAG TPA: GGDEF domain-containing protein [Rugosibacter sp.]